MKSTVLISLFLAAAGLFAEPVTTDVDHPAAKYAVGMLEGRTGKTPVRLTVGGAETLLKNDGYAAFREGDAIVIKGARPRSLLYAAYEPERWLEVAEGKPVVRESVFPHRMLNYNASKEPPIRWIAATGCNEAHLGRNAPARLIREYRDADVEVYAFIYGCNPLKWGEKEYSDFIAAHPSAKGTDDGRSWEKGLMCPSDPATREFFAKKMTDVASSGDYDGVVVTFWDDYGLYCSCRRCRKNGMSNFSRQIAFVVKTFEDALSPLGKKLVVRTWASGAPHFLRGEWVHAPGYAGRRDALDTWQHAFMKAKGDTRFMTKVYNCDCQPNAPFSNLLGEAKGHLEYAEWQITGQTVGLQWLPASVAAHTQRTMRRARELVGANGGVSLYAGGYNNPGYEALDDDVNSANIHVWRQLSWNPDEDAVAALIEWAKPRYGEAAPLVATSFLRSERASTVSFSPLGLGAPTESRFPSTVERREDLLRYTNRHYLPEGRKALTPGEASVKAVIAEKDSALAEVERIKNELEVARKMAKSDDEKARIDEFALRTDWLKTHLLVTKALDGALWRYRYLRSLMDMASTDVEVMKEIRSDFDTVKKESANLFKHEPTLKLSCYREPVGEREITLRSPIPFMRDIESNAVHCVERILGPEWKAK